MRSNEVLRLLKITRPTLCKYVKTGIIKATKNSNGQYNYDDESVYDFLNKGISRKTVLYCRVSSKKQMDYLSYQEAVLKKYCIAKGLKIDAVYTDISNGVTFDPKNRNSFFEMFEEVVLGKIENIIVLSKDRLSRDNFELFEQLFSFFNCHIEAIDLTSSLAIDSEDSQ